MALAVRAQIVDIRADSPKDTDCLLVDTNVWLWLYYSPASLTGTGGRDYQLTCYPAYLAAAISAKSTLQCCGLSFAELAHNIEKTEYEIYKARAENPSDPNFRPITLKAFRHDYPRQRLKIVAQISDTWSDVLDVSKMLDLGMDSGFMESAETLFRSVGLDGYDVFMAEAAVKSGVTQILTDDGDYATVPGLTIFTANERVLRAAEMAGKLVAR